MAHTFHRPASRVFVAPGNPCTAARDGAAGGLSARAPTTGAARPMRAGRAPCVGNGRSSGRPMPALAWRHADGGPQPATTHRTAANAAFGSWHRKGGGCSASSARAEDRLPTRRAPDGTRRKTVETRRTVPCCASRHRRHCARSNPGRIPAADLAGRGATRPSATSSARPGLISAVGASIISTRSRRVLARRCRHRPLRRRAARKSRVSLQATDSNQFIKE